MSQDFKQELEKILNDFYSRLKSLRSFKLSLSFLENLEISLYHQKYPLKSLCLISSVDPLTFRLEPYDPSYLKEIEVALLERKMGLNIIKDKTSLLVKFPPLTEEVKKDILKELAKIREETKIRARILRDEFLKKIKSDKEEGKISEDQFYKSKENLDKEIENFNEKVEKAFKEKEREIIG